jgi:hypothetical protein
MIFSIVLKHLKSVSFSRDITRLCFISVLNSAVVTQTYTWLAQLYFKSSTLLATKPIPFFRTEFMFQPNTRNTHKRHHSQFQQDRQCTFNITVRSLYATIIVVEKQ